MYHGKYNAIFHEKLNSKRPGRNVQFFTCSNKSGQVTRSLINLKRKSKLKKILLLSRVTNLSLFNMKSYVWPELPYLIVPKRTNLGERESNFGFSQSSQYLI